MSKKRAIALSLTEGRTVRDLFYNGLLDYLLEAGFSVTVFTEAVKVPDFVETWRKPGVEFEPLYPCESTTGRSRAFWMRRRLVRLGIRPLLRAYINWEAHTFYWPRREYLETLRRLKPGVLLATHAHMYREAQLISAAHHLKIPTLGLVRSWDNVHKGIRSRPQKMAVWNEINRQEVVELEGYEQQQVHIVGSSQFDPYFQRGVIWPRERLAAHFGLDPERPILLYATLGNFFPEFDETGWMNVLLGLVDRGEIPGRPQIVCRLHPWSRLEQFQKFSRHPDVRLSYVTRYWPALTWYMTREDVIVMANLLAHADVVITPGSTITLEAAIFDRPTLVPVFHPYQPERARNYFATWVMGKHYGRIEKLGLAPLVRDAKDFAPAIKRCLEEPAWFREQRTQLVRDYVYFTDGRSTERLAKLVLRIAQNGSSSKI